MLSLCLGSLLWFSVAVLVFAVQAFFLALWSVLFSRRVSRVRSRVSRAWRGERRPRNSLPGSRLVVRNGVRVWEWTEDCRW